MAPLPPWNEHQLDCIASYPISPDEEKVEAVVHAFDAAGVDVSEKPTQLADWINADTLNVVRWSADWTVYLSTRIWNHRVVISDKKIQIYDSFDPETPDIGG